MDWVENDTSIQGKEKYGVICNQLGVIMWTQLPLWNALDLNMRYNTKVRQIEIWLSVIRKQTQSVC